MALSPAAQMALEHYAAYLTGEVDLSRATLRNYLGDVRLFIVWWEQSFEAFGVFSPDLVATPTLTQYRDYLRDINHCKPATINRYLISLKRYFAWAVEQNLIGRDPARPVKLVAQTSHPPRHLTDTEESALVAAAQANLRDYTLLILMLHTGLRVSEVCDLRRDSIQLGKRSGHLQVWGKRRKYREVPLNATVRQVLEDYLATLADSQTYLFVSQRTGSRLTPRAIGFLVTKYTQRARIDPLSPHDLRHRFGYRMAKRVPLHYLAQLMGHDSLDTTLIYVQATAQDLQQSVEKIAWE